MMQTAYPRFTLRDNVPTDESRLSDAFHKRFLAHFIGQRTEDGIWPAHSSNRDALVAYIRGQEALYEGKDPVSAIGHYQTALDHDPGYLQAWVALAISLVTENSPASLDDAEAILDSLGQIPTGDGGLSLDAASIIQQNRAYLAFHRWRQGQGTHYLSEAEQFYDAAHRFATSPRIEMLCPYAAVLLETGRAKEADRILAVAYGIDPALVHEYTGKYPSLLQHLPNRNHPTTEPQP